MRRQRTAAAVAAASEPLLSFTKKSKENFTTASRADASSSSSSSSTNGYAIGLIIVGIALIVSIGFNIGQAVRSPHSTREAVSMRDLSMEPSAALASPAMCPLADRRLEDELVRMRDRVVLESERRAAVTWREYAAAPEQHAGRRVLMAGDDFVNGTLRIVTSGVFVLSESVEFEPQAWNDWRPDRARQPEYATAPYVLDFFAAITVEADDVVIDLNGHTLRQSNVHATVQRFYANIELGSAPFIAGQGPASFGPEPVRPNGLVVENGVLGRSSHHGMHGNGGRRVLLRHLRLHDYEVAAIALNGFTDVVIDDVHGDGSSHDVSVLGTYSSARFALPFVDRVVGAGASLGIDAAKLARLAAAGARLRTLVDQVASDVRALNRIDVDAHTEAAALFANYELMIDGNAYGLLLHPIGVAVGPFWSSEPPASGSGRESERIYVMNSVFRGTHTHVMETIAVVAANNVTVRGPAGDLMRFTDNAHETVGCLDVETGAYKPNALADVQVALIDASLDVADASVRKRYFGTTNGCSHIVDWAHGRANMADLITRHGYRYWRNGDSMFHVQKGAIGVFIGGSRSVCLENVRVADTRNAGHLGNVRALPGESDDVAASYLGAEDGGHPEQAPQRGYMGADARGVAITGSRSIYLSNVDVVGVHSRVGFSHGIDMFNRAEEVHASNGCSVHNVTTLLDDATLVMSGRYTSGPKVGAARGIHCSGGSAADSFGFGSVVVTHIASGALDQGHLSAVATEIEPKMIDREHVNTYLL